MKITTVSLSRTIPTGAYMNDKIGLEATLEDGEPYQSALNQLNSLITEWHKKANPHLYQESKPPENSTLITPKDGSPQYYIQTERTDPNDTLTLIQNAPTLEVLTTFKLLAGKDKDLYSAYCQRLKYLSA